MTVVAFSLVVHHATVFAEYANLITENTVFTIWKKQPART